MEADIRMNHTESLQVSSLPGVLADELLRDLTPAAQHLQGLSVIRFVVEAHPYQSFGQERLGLVSPTARLDQSLGQCSRLPERRERPGEVAGETVKQAFLV